MLPWSSWRSHLPIPGGREVDSRKGQLDWLSASRPIILRRGFPPEIPQGSRTSAAPGWRIIRSTGRAARGNPISQPQAARRGLATRPGDPRWPLVASRLNDRTVGDPEMPCRTTLSLSLSFSLFLSLSFSLSLSAFYSFDGASAFLAFWETVE